MGDERLIQDAFFSNHQLAIVEKYEDFMHYMYPIIFRFPRQHAVIRDIFMNAMVEQPRLFIEAAKSSQISRLHIADAGIASQRQLLRFMADSRRRLITHTQHRAASVLIAEVGKMVGAWKKDMESKKG